MNTTIAGNSRPSSVFAKVRFPPAVIEVMIQDTVAQMNDERIAKRVASEHAFEMQLASLTHDLLISCTLAQTLSKTAPFLLTIPPAPFCTTGDNDVRAVGYVMLDLIVSIRRLPDAELADDVLKERLRMVRGSI